MTETVTLLTIALIAAAIGLVFYRRTERLRSLDYLNADNDYNAPTAQASHRRPRRFARRYWLVPWMAAGISLLIFLFIVKLPALYSLAFSGILGLVVAQLDGLRLAWTEARIEAQLADAIDLMTGAVNAGAGLQRALEVAAEESQLPLRTILEDSIGRIRFGDDAVEVMELVRQHVPLETFRLFSTAIAVNWQVGGSLAATLANVERTIRDRIELNRRVWSMSMQIRFSVVAVLLVTYLIAAVVWRNDPNRMVAFLNTTVGSVMTSLAILLQGIGLFWLSRMAQSRF